MASRPRRGGATSSPSSASPSRQPVYEDIKPKSRWQEDNENHTLTIDLPGFAKEQIRVSTEGQDIIRVRGERPVTRNRRHRFQEDFQVPANSEMDKVRAKFEGGALIVTVAKKIVDEAQEAPPVKATGTESPKQPVTQQGRDEQPPPVKMNEPREGKSLEPTSGDVGKKRDQPEVPTDGRRGSPFRDAGRVLPRDYEISELNGKHVTEKISEELPDAGTAKTTTLKTDEGAIATPS